MKESLSRTSNISERYNNLDLLKSIAIFLVILYHVGTFYNANIVGGNIIFLDYLKYYLRGFMSIGVPIFFFSNGVLLFKKDFKLKKHLIKICKLVCITVIWTFLSYAIISLFKENTIDIKSMIKSLWSLKFQYNNHLWFLYTLVVIYIFFPLLKLAWDKEKNIFYFFFCAILIVTVGNKLLVQIYNIFAILFSKNIKDIGTNLFSKFNPVSGIYGYAIVYFMLGAICFEYKDRLNTKKNTILSILTLIVSSILLCVYWVIISIYTNSTQDYVWGSYDIIFTLINVIALFIISLNYTGNNLFGKVINIIGKNTLGIYLIHMIIINFFIFLNINYKGNSIREVFYSIVIFLISLIITIIIGKIPILKKGILK